MKTRKKENYRIGIDARFYGPLGKGLGRYTQEVVDNVTALDSKNEYIIFLSKDNFDEFNSKNPKVSKVLADIAWYGWAEQLKFPALIKKQELDLMHFPHFNVPIFSSVPFVVTIHDLILTKFPTTRASTLGPIKYFLKNLAYKFAIKTAIRKAKKIIAVSNFTKQDIVDQFSVPSNKIEMIYEGVATLGQSVDSHFTSKLKDEEILSGYCILEPYLLYVGNAYPHKNLESLIKVFLKLRHNNPYLKLVLVGRDDYFYRRLNNFAKSLGADDSAVIFPGYVPDQDLQTLFEHATLYVFPSKFEGFGLPPLEAMSRGCAVVSSNATCLPEILGQAAEYFDPYDEYSMYASIEKVLTDENLKTYLVTQGQECIRKYSWQKAGKETLKVYLNILENFHETK